MAIDAVLLRSVPSESAFFRHYNWTKPAVTFGYTQRIDEIKQVIPHNIELCRRITGGGIVDHRHDWTYAMVMHSRLKAARMPATELYTIIHRCIQKAMAAQAIETRLSPCPRACGEAPNPPPAGPSQCFVLPAANDVLDMQGRKIAGAAMKRTREGILIQGSINRRPLPTAFDFSALSVALPEILADALELRLFRGRRNLPDEQEIQQERQRFEGTDWASRR